MNEKRSILTITVVTALLVLSGCGGGGGGSNTQSTSTESIGVAQAEEAKLTAYKVEDIVDSPLGRIHRSRVSVLLDDGADNAAFEAAVEANGWKIMSFVKPPANAYSIDTTTTSVDQLVLALEKLEVLAGVVSVDVTREFPGQSVSVNDSGYVGSQWEHIWNHKSIDLGLAWDLVYAQNTVPEVSLGVIDRGMNSAHEDHPVKAVIAGLNLNSDQNHGMHVAGIMAAEGNNGKGVAGITWSNKGSSVYAADMQTFGADEFLNGVERLLARRVRVINLSAGALPDNGDSIFKCLSWWALKQGASFTCGSREDLNAASAMSLALMRQVKKIVEQHERQFPDRSVLFVQSSGNVGNVEIQNTGTYPVSDMNGRFAFAVSDSLNVDAEVRTFFQQRTLIVGAFQQDSNLEPKEITSYTNRPLSNASEYGFILAPGGSDVNRVYSTFNSVDGYDYLVGTSQAAPHVAGVAGLIFQANPNLTAAEVRDIILDNSDTVDGYRALNAAKAVRAAMPSQSTSPILEFITAQTYDLSSSGRCYQKMQSPSQVAPNQYRITDAQWCLNSAGDQWVQDTSGGGNLEVLLPSGVWTSEADEVLEVVNDTTFNLLIAGVGMGAGSVTKTAVGFDGTFVFGNPRYELWPVDSNSYVFNNADSISSLIGNFNIGSPSGNWLSRGGQYGFMFGGSPVDMNGPVYVVDGTAGPDCSSGTCQWTILATGTWSRVTAGTSDIVTVNIPSSYQAYFGDAADEKPIYVKRSGESGVREGRYTPGTHSESWSAYATKSSFDTFLQGRGLPPSLN